MHHAQDPKLPEFVYKLQRVESYSEIEEIMKHPDFKLSGVPERFIFMGDTLFTTEGERHTQLKQLFAPLMSRQAMAYYELRLVEPVIRQTLSEMTQSRDKDGHVRIDVVPLIHAALTRISAQVTGADGVDTPERTNRFRDLVLTLSDATTGSFSDAADPARVTRAGREAIDTLAREFLQPSLDRRIELVRRQRAGEIGMEDLPRDVRTSMCLADDLSHPDDDVKIPYVWRQCTLFLTAAIKTTSHALPHVFIDIAAWLTDHPEDRAKRTDFEWLHRAVAESFRIHQSAPARFRTAVREVTLSTGRRVAEGETVALHAQFASTTDPVFGPQPDRFNPYRELPAAVPAWGMAFGFGVHRCLGSNLVTGIQNRGDDKHGTHGTAVRILKAMYDMGAELDPESPPRLAHGNLHNAWESVPMILTRP